MINAMCSAAMEEHSQQLPTYLMHGFNVKPFQRSLALAVDLVALYRILYHFWLISIVREKYLTGGGKNIQRPGGPKHRPAHASLSLKLQDCFFLSDSFFHVESTVNMT